jgi:hypothetical protein
MWGMQPSSRKDHCFCRKPQVLADHASSEETSFCRSGHGCCYKHMETSLKSLQPSLSSCTSYMGVRALTDDPEKHTVSRGIPAQGRDRAVTNLQLLTCVYPLSFPEQCGVIRLQIDISAPFDHRNAHGKFFSKNLQGSLPHCAY